MLIPAVVLLLQLPISLPIWNHLPKLRFLQFPWRWLLVLEAPLALLVIAALQPLRKASRRVLTVLCFACCVASAVYANHAFYQPCEEQDRPSAVAEVWQHGAGFEGTSEYTPLGADSSLTATGLPAACLADSATLPLGEPRPSNDGDATAPLWSPQQHSCMPVAAPWSGSPEHLRLVTQLPKSGWLILRLNRYPAWRVSLNGQEQKNLPQRADGLIVVPAQAGQADLAVDWQPTPDVWLGRGLSLLGGMILLILVRFNRRSQNA